MSIYRSSNSKTGIRFSGVLAIVILFLVLITAFVMLAPEQIVSGLPEPISEAALNVRYLAFSRTSDIGENYIRPKLVKAIESHKTRISIFCPSMELVKNEMSVLMRNPKYFWLGNRYEIVYSAGFCTLIFRNKYSDIDSLAVQIESAADQIISLIPEGADDYTKALVIHDWLVENIEYTNFGSSYENDIYGAFVMKQCVCDGYAKAFSYLLTKVGIENKIYAGEAENSLMSGSHAWNSAVLGGERYYFDVTWDDPEGNRGNRISHDWFAVTYDEIAPSHFPDEGYEMECTSATACSYYFRNDYVLFSDDKSEVRDMLIKQGNGASFLCSDSYVYSSVKELVEDADEMSELLCSFTSVYGYSFSFNDLRRTVYICWE